jgi:hypothetical protein
MKGQNLAWDVERGWPPFPPITTVTMADPSCQVGRAIHPSWHWMTPLRASANL